MPAVFGLHGDLAAVVVVSLGLACGLDSCDRLVRLAVLGRSLAGLEEPVLRRQEPVGPDDPDRRAVGVLVCPGAFDGHGLEHRVPVVHPVLFRVDVVADMVPAFLQGFEVAVFRVRLAVDVDHDPHLGRCRAGRFRRGFGRPVRFVVRVDADLAVVVVVAEVVVVDVDVPR